ncbi:MAG: 4-hydroxy-3-methylbut-2-en-1-yl diphosphate synthase, partial [Bacteroidaceae bacterium]|nr:4-hydroxy-3-methylbut-2-en-1-yl diphosphate synthase [Bacteroidaceae bacterium]
MDYFNYSRRPASVVQVGNCPLGGTHPIRLQSMTNTDTNNTAASVQQIEEIVAAGGDYVRLTAQGKREAENLRCINIELRKKNNNVPLIADIHFNPNVADIAAQYVEKVRINPGNYVDPARTFKNLTYTDQEYAAEINRIRKRFIPFLAICKAHKTAIRIGVNHGSLSDRILSRYGDTPEGMVESCMEFLRICVENDFKDVVISIKSSNTVVMVQTVRRLVTTMEKEEMFFPLHLGVTEAGDGEDGRIKSAFGIGALLADGLGDTIRVSLSEDPAYEIPVCKELLQHLSHRVNHAYIPGVAAEAYDYLACTRRPTKAVGKIGGNHVPAVFAERLEGDMDFAKGFKPDYVYVGKTAPKQVEEGINYIVDADNWTGVPHTYPAYNHEQLMLIGGCNATQKFLFLPYIMFTAETIACLKKHPEIVVISQSNHQNPIGEHRAVAHQLLAHGLTNPLVFFHLYQENTKELFQLKAAADMGALIIDGFCDGLFLFNYGDSLPHTIVDSTTYAILQAGRVRMSKTEYISCPGCGRTLYNLQETVARIKAATADMKGLKIGIMGCIVNGPGEMADADYGYVGAARGKISLYKGKVCVE